MAASAQKVRDAIDNAIKDSSEIKPGNYITPKVEKQGLFGKPFIVLTGRCTSEKDKAMVVMTDLSDAGDVKVENKLRVSTVS